MAKSRNHNGEIFVAFSAVAILLLLWLWRTKLIRTNVTTTITYDGQTLRQGSLSDYLSRMFSNEYIKDGQLCARTIQGDVCYDGDPLDILIVR